MKKLRSVAVVSMLLASTVFADLNVRVAEEPIPSSSARGRVLRNAIKTFVLSDGSEWITHRLSGYRENSPIGITRIDRDGTEELFLGSNWLPDGTTAPGGAGQIYGITDLEGGFAVAVGWNRDGRSRNAILVLSGSYETVRIIEVPGISSVVGGPKSTILALTDDAAVAGGGPMLTVFDTAGTVLGRFFPGQSRSPGEAVRNSIRSNLQQIASSRYALYDDLRETMFVFDLHVGDYVMPAPRHKWVRAAGATNGAAKVAEHSRIFVGGDASFAQLVTVATHVAKDGRAIVVRTGLVDGAPRSVAAVYRGDGEVIGTWKSKHPWNTVIRSGNEFRGVVMRDGVVLEKADFSDVR